MPKNRPAIQFTKMHGAGNDFVMLDAVSQRLKVRPKDVSRIANRRTGIGCDQVLIAEPPSRPDTDFTYRIFNSDGSEAGQCGNGARCFARFVRHRRLTQKRNLAVETISGLMQLRMCDQQEVEVNMGEPVFDPDKIPLSRDQQCEQYELDVDGEKLSIGALSMGNPHAVLRVASLADGHLERLGKKIESHPDFPERVNAGFMQVIGPNRIKLRVFERGVGETLACGSGACAAVVYGQILGWLDKEVAVELPGGKLAVEWPGPDHAVMLRGPTAISFEGSLRL
ncbi:MAG: diaminopimelate epimerase [Pseudomonadota bacterium]